MAAKIPKSIERARILVVEGNDEDHFFSSLLTEMGSNRDVQIISVDGVDNLSIRLDLIARLENFSSVEKLAIVRDADDSAANAFESVKKIVQKLNLVSPGLPSTFAGGSPSIGIYIMPGNNQNGALEKVCLDALSGIGINSCVDQFVACVQAAGKYQSDPNTDKIRLGAYISTMPGVRLIGEAARSGKLRFEHTAYDQIKGFLSELIK